MIATLRRPDRLPRRIEFGAALFDGRKSPTIRGNITLGSQEPERQAAGVVIGAGGFAPTGDFRTHTHRTLSTGFFPATGFHNDSDQHADGLTESFGASRMGVRQEVVNHRMRFEFPDDARQSRPIVVKLRFLHPPLPVVVVKELQKFLEGVIGIVPDIGKGSTLTVLGEFTEGNGNLTHV